MNTIHRILLITLMALGMGMTPAVAQAAHDLLGLDALMAVYGMTETSACTSGVAPDKTARLARCAPAEKPITATRRGSPP